MAKLDFKEEFWTDNSGKKSINTLTVVVDGNPASTWRKPDLTILAAKNDTDIKGTLKYSLMGIINMLAPKEQEDITAKVIAKIRSYNL